MPGKARVDMLNFMRADEAIPAGSIQASMRARSKLRLRKEIFRSLRRQGFIVRSGRIALPENVTKEKHLKTERWA